MVSFPDAVKLFFTRYVDFQGRSQRSEYWWATLFNVVVMALLFGLGFGLGGNFDTGDINPLGMIFFGLGGLYALGIIIPSIALQVRRLHDINQTGWIALGLYIGGMLPIISLLTSIAQIVIGCLPGTPGPNKYGPDPKGGLAPMADTFA